MRCIGALTGLLSGFVSGLTCLAAMSAELPLQVWVLYDPCDDRSCTTEQIAWAKARVEADVARANEIFSNASARIHMKAHTIRVRAGPALLDGVIDVGCTERGQRVRAALGHAAGRINVYYVRHPGAKGLWCAPDSILIGASAFPETLAHELGHALSLEHLEAGTGDNLMSSTGAMNRLTAEQVERIDRSLATWRTRANAAASGATSPTEDY
jgi:hypothetical protein